MAEGKFQGVIPPVTPDRLLRHEDAPVRRGLRDRVAVDALRLLAEPLEEGGGVLDLRVRLGQRLALLGGEEERQVVARSPASGRRCGAGCGRAPSPSWPATPGSARSAASIARRVSAAPRRGTSAIVSPVAGSTTGNVSPESPSTQLPSTKARVRRRSRSRSGSGFDCRVATRVSISAASAGYGVTRTRPGAPARLASTASLAASSGKRGPTSEASSSSPLAHEVEQARQGAGGRLRAVDRAGQRLLEVRERERVEVEASAARRHADEHRRPSSPRRRERRLRGGGEADRVEGDVEGVRLGEVVRRDCLVGAEGERRLAPRREEVDRHDPPRSGDPRALDDELPHAAGADARARSRPGWTRSPLSAAPTPGERARSRAAPPARAARPPGSGSAVVGRDEHVLGERADRRHPVDGLAVDLEPGRAVEHRPAADRGAQREAGRLPAGQARRALAAGGAHEMTTGSPGDRRLDARARRPRRRPSPRGRGSSAPAAPTRRGSRAGRCRRRRRRPCARGPGPRPARRPRSRAARAGRRPRGRARPASSSARERKGAAKLLPSSLVSAFAAAPPLRLSLTPRAPRGSRRRWSRSRRSGARS